MEDDKPLQLKRYLETKIAHYREEKEEAKRKWGHQDIELAMIAEDAYKNSLSELLRLYPELRD